MILSGFLNIPIIFGRDQLFCPCSQLTCLGEKAMVSN